MVVKTKRNKPAPTAAGRRGKQNRSINRLTAQKISKLLREPPTPKLIHDGGGLWFDNSVPAKRGANGEPIYPRKGRWYYLYELNRKTIPIPIGETQSAPPIEGEFSLADARDERDRLRLARKKTPDLRITEGGPRQKRPFHDLDEFWPGYYDHRICQKPLKRCLLCHDKPEPLCRGTDPETGRHYSEPDVKPPKECRLKWRIWHKKRRWAVYGPIFGHRDITKPEGTGKLLDDLIRPIWNKAQQGKYMYWQIGDHYGYAIEQLRDLGIEGGVNPAAMSWEQREKRFGAYTYETTPRDAMKLDELPHYMARVRAWKTRKARGLELTIHTLHRTDDIMGLWYSQINWHARTITIDAEDRKGGTHDVPLTEHDYALLEKCAIEDGRDPPWNPKLPDEPVFFKKGAVIYDVNNRSMAKFARNIAGQGHRTRIKSGNPEFTFTPHGMRSLLTEWGEKAEKYQHKPFSNDMLQRCMAHLIGKKSHRSYNRAEFLDEKREIYKAWDRFLLSGKLNPGEIVKYQLGGAPIVSDGPLLEEMHRRVQAGEGLWDVAWELAPQAEYRPKRGNPTEESKRRSVAQRLCEKYKRKYGYNGKQRIAASMRAKGLFTIRGTIELLRDMHIHTSKDMLRNAIKAGTLTATRAANGVYEIPLTELQRVYPELIPAPGETMPVVMEAPSHAMTPAERTRRYRERRKAAAIAAE